MILLAGCTQAPKNEYVKLSDAACTFRAADNLPQTVRVNASGSWTAESGASWLTVEQQADALVLTVADNDTDYDRSTESSSPPAAPRHRLASVSWLPTATSPGSVF